MYIDHDRQVFDISGRLPDIQIQGILAVGIAGRIPQLDLIIVIADDGCQGTVNRTVFRLHAHGCEGVADLHPFPAIRILRFFPSQVTDRRSGIGNAGIDLHLAVFGIHTLQITVMYMNDFRIPRILIIRGRIILQRCRGQHSRHNQCRKQSQPGTEFDEKAGRQFRHQPGCQYKDKK